MDWSATRERFETLDEVTYLNTCSLAALARPVRSAVDQHLDDWGARGASAWYDRWLDVLGETRQGFARLIGAREDEVAIGPNVSTALSTVVSGIDPSWGHEVVLTELDFPTLGHQFLARDTFKTTFVDSPDGVEVPPEEIGATLGDETAALATSHVFFASGALQDVERLSSMAKDAGALSIVDAYQATGQVPTDVDEIGCDVLLTGGLKWLLGGTGIAYLYVSRDAQRRLDPDLAGWFGDREQFAFETKRFQPRPDARRFELGTPSLPSVFAGRAGLKIVEEIGPERIRERQNTLVDDLYERLDDRGFDLATPASSDRRAGIVMVRVDDPPGVVEALAERDIIVDHRPGRVRISPYFYNTFEEIEAVVDAVDEIAG